MNESDNTLASRSSGIELLKIIGILLIIIHHVIQTLYSPNKFIGFQEYVLDISHASKNLQNLILAMLDSGGAFGNTVFFVCSAWFLLDSGKSNSKKILQIMLDTWIISVLIFSVVYMLRGGNIETGMVIKQFFPITFGNNWYITCYVLFYAIHPYLNVIINKMSQQELFTSSFILLVLYFGVNFIHGGAFFESKLIIWITIYFVVGYTKLYLRGMSQNIKINIMLFAIGFLGNAGLVLFTNYLGLRFDIFSSKLLRWGKDGSPFILLMSISLLNIARNSDLRSKHINFIASLSLYIYVIHENILLRIYYRPLMWQFVFEKIGYSYVLLITIVMALAIFVFSGMISACYVHTVQKKSRKLCERMHSYIYKLHRNIVRHIW